MEANPTRREALIFRGKVLILQGIRQFRNQLSPPQTFQAAPSVSRAWRSIATHRSPLYTSANPAELLLQAGKVQNLRVAAARLNRLVIPAGSIFSFWAHVPRPTAGRGYAAGRELRQGCIVPSVGGGLCQLSNALYDVALTSGFEIVERHPHSIQIPGSLAAQGRDATIFWNYVDLRFRATFSYQLLVRLLEEDLVVEILAETRPVIAPESAPPSIRGISATVESCETCGVESCFRHRVNPGAQAKRVWLLDAWTPEFDAWMLQKREREDHVFVPLRSHRFGNYRWRTAGFERVLQSPFQVLLRSIVSRKLATQGAARQRALLRMDRGLAYSYLKRLPVMGTHLVISQNLLPFLWLSGALGGRTFDVLMTRFPAASLQMRLDRAAKQHPCSGTLADFRADSTFVEAETRALESARHWISPHTGILAEAGDKAVKLDWIYPKSAETKPLQNSEGPILFPASTLARKGAFELREAAVALKLPIALGGPVLESAEFWREVSIVPNSPRPSMVVLPAWIEHQPRRLLRSLGEGIPVVASDACGLEGVPGVKSIPVGDVTKLIEAIAELRTKPAFSSL